MTWTIRTDGPIARGEACPYSALERAAAVWADRPALVLGDAALSYRELRSQVDRVARGLREIGVGPGTKLGIFDANSVPWVLTYYGAARLGAIIVPLHTRYTPQEIEHVLRMSGVSVLVVGERYVTTLRDICDPTGIGGGELRAAGLPELKRVIRTGPSDGELIRPDRSPSARTDDGPPGHACGPEDVMMVMYTSGSTRFPKGVVLKGGSILRNAFNVGERLGLTPEDRIFSAMPFYHAGGSILTLLTALAHGSCVVTLDHYDAEAALDAIESNRCTIRLGMDVMYLKESGSARFTPDRIRTLRTGWIAASPEVALVAFDRMRFPFVNLYGMTELSGNCTMTSPDDPTPLRLEWAGEPQPGVEVQVFDPETGSPCAIGIPGEIRVRGWNVTEGYYKDPEATANVLGPDGWFRTGDRGMISERGYLKFMGRTKDMLKVGGENVSSAEVEACIQSHDSVRLAQVVGVPDHTFGEVPFAFIELRSGRTCSELEIVEHCARQLARFKVPRYVRFLSASDWPLTGPDKVHKPVLRSRAIDELGLERSAS